MFVSNKTSKNNLKILISYHKPSIILSNNIFCPIQVGRDLATETSKDGKITKQDYMWMLHNMIGDNTGDNISGLNRYFNETTSMYWAWKNYEKLDNPAYIGFMHYRRHFITNNEFYDNIFLPYGNKYYQKINTKYLQEAHISEKSYLELLNNNPDIICMKPFITEDSVLENFTRIVPNVNRETMLLTSKIVKNLYPEYSETIDNYYKSTKNIWYHSFIMKKELFFEYMEWLFPILFRVHSNLDYSNIKHFETQREVAYMAERLFAVWVNYKIKQGCNVKYVQLSIVGDTERINFKPLHIRILRKFGDLLLSCLTLNTKKIKNKFIQLTLEKDLK